MAHAIEFAEVICVRKITLAELDNQALTAEGHNTGQFVAFPLRGRLLRF